MRVVERVRFVRRQQPHRCRIATIPGRIRLARGQGDSQRAVNRQSTAGLDVDIAAVRDTRDLDHLLLANHEPAAAVLAPAKVHLAVGHHRVRRYRRVDMEHQGVGVDVGVTGIDVGTRHQHLAAATDLDRRHWRGDGCGSERAWLDPETDSHSTRDRIRSHLVASWRVVHVASNGQQIPAARVDGGKAHLNALVGLAGTVAPATQHDARASALDTGTQHEIGVAFRVALPADDQLATGIERDALTRAAGGEHVAHHVNDTRACDRDGRVGSGSAYGRVDIDPAACRHRNRGARGACGRRSTSGNGPSSDQGDWRVDLRGADASRIQGIT